FLLGRIKELSGGKSLAANLALVYHNAARGAELAVAYANMEQA
ncbi:MAG: pseudouridine-5'-phosphate glycosidase, partial [Spirochaetes bacterium]|nr:pseudouridine-5'-phosphate glycosidase [Spirochaetota bacterium]